MMMIDRNDDRLTTWKCVDNETAITVCAKGEKPLENDHFYCYPSTTYRWEIDTSVELVSNLAGSF